MKHKTGLFSRITAVSVLVASTLISCSPLAAPGAPEGLETPLEYATVSAMLTETARVEMTAIAQVLPGVTPTAAMELATSAATPSPAVSPSRTMQSTSIAMENTQEGNSCDIAQAGRPIDITIPDGAQLPPGQFFSKTWRLVNNGTCTWTQEYAAVWFSGDNLGLSPIQYLGESIPPGQSVDVTVDMISPLEPGVYQSNWKLRNSQGRLFGIGPQGDAPFWVRIEVLAVETITPTPFLSSPTLTPIPVIFASGTIALQLNQKADLDSGLLDQPVGNDFILNKGGNGLPAILPENGAKFAYFGETVPEIQNCLEAPISEEPIQQDQLHQGAYFCYRTTAGLPGRMFISKINAGDNQLDLEFVTWVVP